ncbi:MAG TPA: carboxypeptidase regulatory-like domain-containing protein [Longimicrobiales bacterium]
MMSKTSGSRIALGTIVAIFMAACGAGGPADDAQTSEAAAQSDAAAAPVVDPATAATITGRIALEGTPPAREPIDMSEEPTCAAKHPSGATTQDVIVGEGGGLQNVFVYIKEGLGDRAFPAPSEPVVLNQDGCLYHPHILGIQPGQTLTIRNSDGLLHNISVAPTENRGFNVSQPVNMETERSFDVPEVMIPVECDVHGWMHAYIGVVDHPYYAVTAADGSFTIPNLPPGDYVIEAWHEKYGVQTMNVTVGASETKQIQFTYDAGAVAATVPLGAPLIVRGHGSAAHAAHAATTLE